MNERQQVLRHKPLSQAEMLDLIAERKQDLHTAHVEHVRFKTGEVFLWDARFQHWARVR